MDWKRIAWAAAMTAAAGEALAALPLRGAHVGPVVEIPGPQEQLASAGRTCMAQRLRSGLTVADVILTADLPGGVVVARSQTDLAERGSPISVKMRSRVTLEARANRLRIRHDDVELLIGRAWLAAREALPGKPDAVADHLTEVSNGLTECVKRRMRDDW